MQKELKLIKSIWTAILIGILIYLGWLLVELSSTKQSLTEEHQGLEATLKIVEKVNKEFQIQNLKSLQAGLDQLIR